MGERAARIQLAGKLMTPLRQIDRLWLAQRQMSRGRASSARRAMGRVWRLSLSRAREPLAIELHSRSIGFRALSPLAATMQLVCFRFCRPTGRTSSFWAERKRGSELFLALQLLSCGCELLSSGKDGEVSNCLNWNNGGLLRFVRAEQTAKKLAHFWIFSLLCCALCGRSKSINSVSRVAVHLQLRSSALALPAAGLAPPTGAKN